MERMRYSLFVLICMMLYWVGTSGQLPFVEEDGTKYFKIFDYDSEDFQKYQTSNKVNDYRQNKEYNGNKDYNMKRVYNKKKDYYDTPGALKYVDTNPYDKNIYFDAYGGYNEYEDYNESEEFFDNDYFNEIEDYNEVSQNYTVDPETQTEENEEKEDTCDCGTRKFTDDFNFGDENVTDYRKYPWLVGVRESYFPDDAQWGGCSGFIISSHYVLTAANCIYLSHENVSLITIALKGDNFSTPAKYLSVREAIIHPKYNYSNHENDIGLLRTVEEIPCSYLNRPICIPKYNSFNTDEQFITAGWGFIEKVIADGLQEGLIIKTNNEDCARNMKHHFDEKRMICAKAEGKSPCSMDYGSPLMAKSKERFFAIGITSYTLFTGCNVDTPIVYINIASYYFFINEYVDLTS